MHAVWGHVFAIQYGISSGGGVGGECYENSGSELLWPVAALLNE